MNFGVPGNDSNLTWRLEALAAWAAWDRSLSIDPVELAAWAAWARSLSIDPVELAPLGYPAILALLDTASRWTTCGTTELCRLIKIAKTFQYKATEFCLEQTEAGRIIRKALPGYILVLTVPVGIHERI